MLKKERGGLFASPVQHCSERQKEPRLLFPNKGRGAGGFNDIHLSFDQQRRDRHKTGGGAFYKNNLTVQGKKR